MNKTALFCDGTEGYVYPPEPKESELVTFRFRTAKDDVDRVGLVTSADTYVMEKECTQGEFDYYTFETRLGEEPFRYCFEVQSGTEKYYYGRCGISREILEYYNFVVVPGFSTPDWAKGAVMYQIFTDRFYNGDKSNDVETNEYYYIGDYSRRVTNWDKYPANMGVREFYGGDLQGVMDKLDYLQDLGVEVVYFNPLFVSPSNHKYDIQDYDYIDPHYGKIVDDGGEVLPNGVTDNSQATKYKKRTTGFKNLEASNELFIKLVEELHRRGMKVILDGVFNHCGLGFAPFRDAMEKGKASEYYDWFFFGEQYPCGYMTFGEKWAYMPKLNMQNEACAAYFLDVGRYWLREAHVDGWRLDVSPEVYPDFWRQFRRAVLQTKPDAIMIAECWHDSREWCTVGDMFDGTMHYVLSEAIWKFFAERRWSLAQFDAGVNRAMMLYPQEVQNSMWNFLSSHDTARMLTRCGGRVKAMRAAVFFQMTHPGVPVIYYGDELAMRGGPDPDCRRSMTWDKVDGNAMLAYYKRLTHMRGESEVLREGTLRTWEVGEDGLYAYLRQTERETVLCALNTSERAIRRMIRLPEALAGCKAVRDLMTGKTHNVQGGYVTLALGVCEGAVLGRAEA